MPLTLTLSAGVLPDEQITQAVDELCQAFLDCHGLLGNAVLTPNVLATVQQLPADSTFAGGRPGPLALVEWKVPGFAFAEPGVQQDYVRRATDILARLSDQQLGPERIWVNVVHAVDGAWGIGGQALSNERLTQMIAQG